MADDSGWLRWVADSVAGVFAIEPLAEVKAGGAHLLRRWTATLAEKGSALRIPGTGGKRVGDLVRGNVVTRVWPGRESRLYRVVCNELAATPEEQYPSDLTVTAGQVEADDRPVAVLLHGFCSTTTGPYFGPLKSWLTAPETGRYGLVLGFECDTLQRRVPDLAADLRGHLERVGLLRGQRRVDLYTHSLGGLVARWLLENPDDPDSPAQRTVRASVRRLIMAGPPNLGTRAAELGDRLLSVLQRRGPLLHLEAGPVAAAFRVPLVFALARRLAARVPSAGSMLQVLDDVQPGSPLLTALRAHVGDAADSPSYHLVQGIYDPVPAGETVAVRLLREAGALIGDCDARWSDLIVSAESQAGFVAPGSHLPRRFPQGLILTQTWHHQYWTDQNTFAAIRRQLLERLPI